MFPRFIHVSTALLNKGTSVPTQIVVFRGAFSMGKPPINQALLAKELKGSKPHISFSF